MTPSVSPLSHCPYVLKALSDLSYRLGKHTTLFPPFTSTPSRSSSGSPSAHRYKIIHPLTPLSELETFLRDQEGHFALVTDRERKWVLGVATVSDLEVGSTPGNGLTELSADHCPPATSVVVRDQTFVKRRGGTLEM
jgi:hypothetical protein